jgi:replicative superfamily II helicase
MKSLKKQNKTQQSDVTQVKPTKAAIKLMNKAVPMEISWTDRVRNEEVLQRVEEKRNILRRTKRKAKWFGHIWCRNCLLKHVTEENMEGRGRRRKHLLNDLKERRLYCKLNEEPLDHNLWELTFEGTTRSRPVGTHFRRGCRPVVSHTE